MKPSLCSAERMRYCMKPSLCSISGHCRENEGTSERERENKANKERSFENPCRGSETKFHSFWSKPSRASWPRAASARIPGLRDGV